MNQNSFPLVRDLKVMMYIFQKDHLQTLSSFIMLLNKLIKFRFVNLFRKEY